MTVTKLGIFLWDHLLPNLKNLQESYKPFERQTLGALSLQANNQNARLGKTWPLTETIKATPKIGSPYMYKGALGLVPSTHSKSLVCMFYSCDPGNVCHE